MSREQHGRVVLINGASGGLGPAVVQVFVEEGSNLVLTARRQEQLEQTATDLGLDMQKTLLVPADLTDRSAVAKLISTTKKRFGPIDVVAHVTGGFSGGVPVQSIEPDAWHAMLNLNLTAAFLVARAVLPSMLERGTGKLVFVSSRSGSQPTPNLAEYTVSKSSLDMFVQVLAEETRQHGVNVNAVAPSVIDTPTNRKFNPKADYDTWVTPESIAGVIQFLASDAARDIHGAIVPIYGRA
ncbi:MAG: SDR family NAD(P)-dependent oxidoreductase [Chloroflexaceae bacterium]